MELALGAVQYSRFGKLPPDLTASAVSILIVEDEALVAHDIAQRLSRLGHSVVGLADDAATAMDLAKTRRPDLILMDIGLRGAVDGLQTAVALRNELTVPIVFLTAHSDAQSVRRARESGTFGYIVKPFTTNDIRIALELALYRFRVEQLLRENGRWFATALGSIADGVIAVDARGVVLFVNATAEGLTGLNEQSVIGLPLDTFALWVDEEDGTPVDPVRALYRANGHFSTEAVISHTGIPVEIRSSRIDDEKERLGTVITFRDVSERRQFEEKLRQLALEDQLTGLPNRSALYERVWRILKAPDVTERSFFILFLDLDNFKIVNDDMGHAIGDLLLIEMADRLRGTLKAPSTVARFGGDEFVILLHSGDRGEATRVAELALQMLRKPIALEGREFELGTSIGIASFPADGEDIESVLRRADSAMYLSKELGKNRYTFFSNGHAASAERHTFPEAAPWPDERQNW